MREVISIEGMEMARFLLKIGKSEILIIETPSSEENESYINDAFGENGGFPKIFMS